MIAGDWWSVSQNFQSCRWTYIDVMEHFGNVVLKMNLCCLTYSSTCKMSFWSFGPVCKVSFSEIPVYRIRWIRLWAPWWDYIHAIRHDQEDKSSQQATSYRLRFFSCAQRFVLFEKIWLQPIELRLAKNPFDEPAENFFGDMLHWSQLLSIRCEG